MRTHELKTLERYWRRVEMGVKTFEIRKNDRDFQVGDMLRLVCVDDDGEEEDAALWLMKEVSYITDYEQKPGYVVMALVEPTR